MFPRFALSPSSAFLLNLALNCSSVRVEITRFIDSLTQRRMRFETLQLQEWLCYCDQVVFRVQIAGCPVNITYTFLWNRLAWSEAECSPLSSAKVKKAWGGTPFFFTAWRTDTSLPFTIEDNLTQAVTCILGVSGSNLSMEADHSG